LVSFKGFGALLVSCLVFFELNKTDWVVRQGFNQNRAFLGFEFPFGKEQRVEMG